MSLRWQAPRGTQDVLPPDSSAWLYVENAFRAVCHRFGYREVRTPVFEETSVFARGIGEGTDIVAKEMYVLTDRGGRSLALRPEGTAGIVRAFVQHGIGATNPVWKVYYLCSIFRYERPQAGRYRQAHQVGVECFGPAGPDVDAEVIALNMAWYEELGIEGHNLALNSVGCPQCRPAHRTALREHLGAVAERLCPTCRGRLDTNPMRVFDCKSPDCQSLLDGAPAPIDYLCEQCEAHLSGLKDVLADLGVPYTMDRRLVRGLDYYTRTTFEVKFSKLGAQDALSGGGRYDGLVEELGGRPTPGIGFAAGVERALLALAESGIAAPDPLPAGVFVIGLDPETRRLAGVIAGRLRRRGVRAETDFMERGLGAQLRAADRLGARYAAIIGEDEMRSGHATVRDLASGEQAQVLIDGVPEWIAQRLSVGDGRV